MVWDEPYLETCCRAALQRLRLAAAIGRPPGLKDGPCLARLVGMGLAEAGADARLRITCDGIARHASEILKQPSRPVGQTAPTGSKAVAAS
jgi:hypothetical protein